MKSGSDRELILIMPQIRADLIAANSLINKANEQKGTLAKHLKGLAGFHLQQAAEKLIKIQIYNKIEKPNHARIYKHNLLDLYEYANDNIGNIIMPNYILQHIDQITSWEAKGRYDVHSVVRKDTLEKCYHEIESWMEEVDKALKIEMTGE